MDLTKPRREAVVVKGHVYGTSLELRVQRADLVGVTLTQDCLKALKIVRQR